MKTLDMSFSAPDVTREWALHRIAEGYQLLVVDLWTGNRVVPGAEGALRIWREAGGIPASYFVVHDAAPVSKHFENARNAAGNEWPLLRFVAIDVEVDPTTIPTIRAAEALVKADNLRPVVYTGEWFWKQFLNNSQDCADLPLWDASYGITPSLEKPRYGAWDKRTGHQHQGTTNLDGLLVDLNIFDDAFVLHDTTQQDWQTVIDVVNGWSNQSAQMSKELADVAAILRRLRPPT